MAWSCNYHFRGAVPYNATIHSEQNDVIDTTTSYTTLTLNTTQAQILIDEAEPQLLPEIERILLTRVVVSICSFGVLGNIVTLILLMYRRWTNNKKKGFTDSNVARADILGLICLSLSDLLFCVSILPHAFTEFDRFTYDEPTFGLYFSLTQNGIINSFIMTSTWLTVSMTINRYAHLCHPILGLKYFGSHFMVIAIIISTVFSLVFNLPRFWLYKVTSTMCIDPVTNRKFLVYAMVKGFMKENATLEAVYQWLYFFVGISIPLCSLAYCNCRIIHAVYNSVAVEQRRNRERTLITKILICIVIFYLLLVSPAEIIKFFSNKINIGEHVQNYNFAVTVLNTFQAVNFSCNFIPYLVLDKKFRYLFTGLCRKGKQKATAVPSRCKGSRYESVSNFTESVPMSSTDINCVHLYNLKKQFT